MCPKFLDRSSCPRPWPERALISDVHVVSLLAGAEPDHSCLEIAIRVIATVDAHALDRSLCGMPQVQQDPPIRMLRGGVHPHADRTLPDLRIHLERDVAEVRG